jgi:hypothetical protein
MKEGLVSLNDGKKTNIPEAIRKVIDFYALVGEEKVFENDRFFEDSSKEMLYPRLNRAAYNQVDEKSIATLSRYAIWAATVRAILIDSLNDMQNDELESAKKRIVLSINALGAFVDIQAIFEDCNEQKGFYDMQKILSSYK